jgi:heptosyltransferase-3
VRILFLKPKMIGDGLMLTPTLAAVRAAYPDAEIWVVVRRGCEGILAGCPAIDHIEAIAAPFGDKRGWLSAWHDLRVLLRLRRRRFDYLFELGDGHRARWFCLGIGARRTCSVKPATPFGWFWRRCFDDVATYDWRHSHRVEKDFFTVRQFLPIAETPSRLVFDQSRARAWPPGADLRDFAVIHPGTREPVKRWPRERWLEVGRFLLGRFANIVISSGPRPEEQIDACWLADQLGPRAVNTCGQATWPQLAGLLYRAKLFVGVDTAAMHLAAACATPIVALFGPSIEEHWRPWQAACRLITPPLHSDAVVPPGYDRRTGRRTADITTADVIAACEALLADPGRDLPGDRDPITPGATLGAEQAAQQ